jgi:ribosome-associated toxin RatA of RatAB toxin-antitoxin module
VRTVLRELEVASVAASLPAEAETCRVVLTATGPRARGTHIDLPAFATDPRLDPGLPAHLRRRIDRFSAVAFLAARAALAALPADQCPPRERIGVFLTNTRAGWAYGEPELGLCVNRGPQAMHAYQATAWFPAAAQGELTIALDLRGCAKTTAGRESGFAEAIWLARDALERDAVDLAIVGAAESLVSDFVLRDWVGDEPLPADGLAEGAVVFALRRPSGRGDPQLVEMHYTVPTTEPDACWVPTLAAACRLRSAVIGSECGREITVALGGGHRVSVRRSGTEIQIKTNQEDPMTTAVLSQTTRVGDLEAEARHQLIIPGPAAEVFEMTRDVLRWTEYMPAVTSAAFVEQSADGDLVEITAEANDQKHTWRSRRAVDRAAMTIEFSRMDPAEPLVSMQGRWEFVADGDRTHAVLTHRFSTTNLDALTFYTDATRSNATRDLEGLAEFFAQAGAQR